ncbi:MAG: hypothetical protein ACE5J2_08850 [Nitrososphaerales archaeon]
MAFMPLLKIDTTVTDPLAELEAIGLISTEKGSNNIVPRPTAKFYKELEELSKVGEFRPCDLVSAVHRIISRYEPVDAEIYSFYMLIALANSSEWIHWADRSINPAAILDESGVTSLIELISCAESK